MANNNPLSLVEQSSIAKSLLIFINGNYSNLPVNRIEYQSLDTKKSSMAIYNLSNSFIEKQYINGSYTANYRFSIVYRSIPTNTNQRVTCETLLENISNWLLHSDLNTNISLTNKRTVNSIKLVSPPVLYKQYQNGTEDYHTIFSLNYTKEV